MKGVKLLIPIVLVALLMSVFATAQFGKLLVIEFNLGEDDSVELVDMRAYEGSLGMDEVDSSEYRLSLLDSTSKVLHTTYFTATFEAWATPVDPEKAFPFPEGEEENIGKFGNVARDKVEMILRVPYLIDAVKFQIKHKDKVLFESDIDLCNEDSTCQTDRGENSLSCRADCPSGTADGYCDEMYDGTCDPDCTDQARENRDSDCTCGNVICDPREDFHNCIADCKDKPANLLMTYIIIAIVVVVVIIALIVFLIVLGAKKKKKKKAETKASK